jgi:hypothetical protein
MAKTQWTKERLQALIERSDIALERSILAIYARQTADEQAVDATSQKNNLGFNGVDAPFASGLAKQILENKYGKPDGERLSVKQRPFARKFMRKYWKQLQSIAKSKEAQAQAQEVNA